ncbi:hypothetical protein [Albibacterium sp.]|uniref:hypothetical protein n=1 Tax=Albibacterium sp. TaxID=2952885 RepID=UPI002B965F21|nr:hypothetical protein [Albibacterium sp.]HUH19718.1 hypothetical protein [Albibacterium sp.]
MSNNNENKKGKIITPDRIEEEGLADINSSSGDSPDNVISNTQKKIQDAKHGRKHGEPLTGTSPKAGD